MLRRMDRSRFQGKSGKLKLHTENGPISVALQGTGWSDGGLVADAVNGPVSLSVPSELKPSFVLESTGHSPISCHASVCEMRVRRSTTTTTVGSNMAAEHR